MLSGSEILSFGDLSLLESEEQPWGEGITLREHFTQDVSINGSRAVIMLTQKHLWACPHILRGGHMSNYLLTWQRHKAENFSHY